jgi:hypothetical protein
MFSLLTAMLVFPSYKAPHKQRKRREKQQGRGEGDKDRQTQGVEKKEGIVEHTFLILLRWLHF